MRDDEPTPKVRYIPFEELVPDDMPEKQSGAYKHLARTAAQMAREHALKGIPPPDKETFLKMLFHRTGIADPRRRGK